MFNQFISKVNKIRNDKDTLTIWLNNLLVLYAFMLPISQTIKATVFTFTVIIFLVRGNLKYYIKEAFSNKVVQSFVYLFVIYVVGLLWTESQNLKEGLLWVKSIKYGLYLIVFYSFIDGRYIKKVLVAFLLGMLVSELTSYAIHFGIMPVELDIGSIHFYDAPSRLDPTPFLFHMHYSVALSLVVVLLLQQIYLSKKTTYIRVFASIFVLTATTNIFITGGRAGYFSFIFLLLFLAIFYLRRWAIIGVVFIGLVLGIAYNNSQIFQQKVYQTKSSIEQLLSEKPNFNTSIGIRAGIYYYGWKALKDNIILGLGTGDSMHEIYKQSPLDWLGREQPHEHNQFFSVLMKVGLVGLIVFLNIYYQIFRYEQKDKELRYIMIFTTLAVFFGILTTQFNMRFFMPLWIVMLSITLISKERRTIVATINDTQVFKQTFIAGVLFSIASLLHQLLK